MVKELKKAPAAAQAAGNRQEKRRKDSRLRAEKRARNIFLLCGIIAILAVGCITFYMIWKGVPGAVRVGIPKLLFGTEWAPTAAEPKFGILYIILTSVVGTALAVLIGVPIGLMTAVFLTEVAPEGLAKIVQPAVELLAAIPSVIYGLIGLMVLNPWMYTIEKKVYAGSAAHRFTGGANLLSAVIVLAIMILPTVINISSSSLRAVPGYLKSSSLALGATEMQTIFRVLIPAARSGILSGIVLGIGRALGEAMAICLVSGNSVNPPFPFNSVRFLTTAIVSEMGYAEGLHREVLFTIGLVLFVFIMIVNLVMTKLLTQKAEAA